MSFRGAVLTKFNASCRQYLTSVVCLVTVVFLFNLIIIFEITVVIFSDVKLIQRFLVLSFKNVFDNPLSIQTDGSPTKYRKLFHGTKHIFKQVSP